MLDGSGRTWQSIWLLATTDVLQYQRGNDDWVAVHRTGLQRMVHMRGGLEAGDFTPMLRQVLRFILAMCDLAVRRCANSKSIGPRLTYPSHPFCPGLSQLISTLPDGLVELSLSCQFSRETITILHRMSSIVRQGHTAAESDYVVILDVMNLALCARASLLERTVGSLILFFVMPIQLGSRVKLHLARGRTERTIWDLLMSLSHNMLSVIDV
jgi:hypothetical protein